MSEELKLITDLLSDVSQHALIGVVIYMLLNFLKYPTIIATCGYCLNIIVKNLKVVKK